MAIYQEELHAAMFFVYKISRQKTRGQTLKMYLSRMSRIIPGMPKNPVIKAVTTLSGI